MRPTIEHWCGLATTAACIRWIDENDIQLLYLLSGRWLPTDPRWLWLMPFYSWTIDDHRQCAHMMMIIMVIIMYQCRSHISRAKHKWSARWKCDCLRFHTHTRRRRWNTLGNLLLPTSWRRSISGRLSCAMAQPHTECIIYSINRPLAERTQHIQY